MTAIETMLAEARQLGASDLFIASGKKPRGRFSGVVTEFPPVKKR